VSFYSGAVGVKRPELLREIVPSAGVIGLDIDRSIMRSTFGPTP